MGIILGAKVRNASTGTREFKIEKENKISLMSSGIKIRKAALTAMGFSSATPVWYVESEGKLFITQVPTDSPVKALIGQNNSFFCKGLGIAMLKAAGKEPVGAKLILAGEQANFNVDVENPVVDSDDAGNSYTLYELTFDSYLSKEEAEKAESTLEDEVPTTQEEAKPSKKSKVQDEI